MTGGATSQKSKQKTNLLLEELPLIKENIMKEAEKSGGLLQICKRQEKIFLISQRDKILKLAQRLSSAYNTDVLSEIEEKISKSEGGNDNGICKNCSATADKKCSKCKQAYYCSR